MWSFLAAGQGLPWLAISLLAFATRKAEELPCLTRWSVELWPVYLYIIVSVSFDNLHNALKKSASNSPTADASIAVKRGSQAARRVTSLESRCLFIFSSFCLCSIVHLSLEFAPEAFVSRHESPDYSSNWVPRRHIPPSSKMSGAGVGN